MKLTRLSISNPIDTIKIINLKFFKNVIHFLLNKEENGDRVFNKYQQIFFKPGVQNSPHLHPGAKELVSLYKLPVERGKGPDEKIDEKELHHWIENLHRLSNFRPEPNCMISIIIPVHNHIRFTLTCLHSIFINAGRTDFEIIIADDMSTDETQIAFEGQIKNVRYFRNNKNRGFLYNCNTAADHAIARFLVFLNNDIIVLPGWLNELIKPLEENPSVGLVGSKLIYPDGWLQEAGGIIFNDASGWNYGRFDHPGKPQYNFLRDADYCSGASLAISSDLWQRIGGFDTRFSPAYYEDTDLAFQVRKAGKRVVYQPLSEVVHFEGVSHGTSENESVKQYQPKNKLKFLAKWKDELTAYGTCNPSCLSADRVSKGRILVIDAVTPTPDKDSGSIDTYNFLKIFKDLGYHVTFIPENLQYCLEYTHALRRIGVECVHLPWFANIQKAVEHYAPGANFVFLYRAYVAEPLVETVRKSAPKTKIIFNTVDLHFLRKKREAEILKSPIKQLAAKHMQEIELGIMHKVDATILLSAYEMELASQLAPNANLFHIPVVRDIPGPSKTPWEMRRDIVFIGGYQHPPNIDAVLFFVKNIWPHLRAAGFSGRFVIAGSQMPDEIKTLASEEIVVRGYIPDLSDLFDSCRLSVAPLRYGAGMKGKVITSLSYGVPCVATSMAVEGSGLVAGKDILVEDDPKQMAELIRKAYDDKSLWEKLSGAGLNYCIENCSIEAVKKKLTSMLSAISEKSEIARH